MRDFGEITRELEILDKVQAELATIATRTDDRRRHDLIDLRRKLSLQIAQVGKIADPIFAEATPELAQTYRIKFSRMRSAAAMHQASWPAVRLGESIDIYHKSALTVREANRDFVAWVRATLGQWQDGR